ncbi:MAG: NfeD family protein [Acidobacteria bacterium]|nr:NfeD family protein [Acidobacteriota bacterium]
MQDWYLLIFIGIGLALVLLELLMGLFTGFDLVFLGSAFILGGLISWPFHSWVLALVATMVICVAYIALGRKYVHRWAAVKKEISNIDRIIGLKGIVLHAISAGTPGLVRVGNEEWRARAETAIEQGAMIEVTEISGVTLRVKKCQGGN